MKSQARIALDFPSSRQLAENQQHSNLEFFNRIGQIRTLTTQSCWPGNNRCTSVAQTGQFLRWQCEYRLSFSRSSQQSVLLQNGFWYECHDNSVRLKQ